MKRQKVRVVPWMEDSMRANTATACLFYGAMAKAGADGVYTVDSRGNSTPLATRVYIRRIREAVGPSCDVYVQHHNDMGIATANAIAAAEAGANWIDASVIGIGDRGGCVALEEAAALFEMYGVDTGVALEKLYDLCCYVRDAYGIQLPPWKPIVGSNWNKEEGAGHLEGSDNAEATIGIAPRVVGRELETVIGGKILFGRERSSAHTDDPVLLRNLMREWSWQPTEEQFQTVLFRARAAVATSYGRHYLTFDEFRSICEGVMLSGYERR
jgi:homocitrate synthase NifV